MGLVSGSMSDAPRLTGLEVAVTPPVTTNPNHAPEEEADTSWPPIIDPETTWVAGPTPSFPVHALPKPIRTWVEDEAESLGTEPGAIAVPALVSAGALIGNTLRIHPRANDKRWAEPPNLYALLIGGPTTMKSPALRHGLGPLDQIQKNKVSTHNTGEADRKASKASATAEIARLQGKLADTESDTTREELELALASEHRKLLASEAQPRMLAINDTTVEQAGVLLSRPENRSGMLIKRQEMSGLLSQMKRAGHEGDRAFYLEAYDGIDSYTTERVTRGRTHIDVMTLSMIGAIQPTEIQPIINDVLKSRKNDGFLQRFQLTVWLDMQDRGLGGDQAPDQAALDLVRTAYESMDRRTHQREATLPSGEFEGISLGLEAQQAFNEWSIALHERARQAEQTGRTGFAAHLGKARATAMRLALITFESERNDTSTHVTLDQLVRACELTDYFLTHAKKTYGTHLPVDAGALEQLWEDIKAGDIHDGQPFRDAYRSTALPTKVSDARALVAAATPLGWLRVESTPGRSGPDTVILRLHPDLR